MSNMTISDEEIEASVERQRKALAERGVREPQLTAMAYEFAFVERLLARADRALDALAEKK